MNLPAHARTRFLLGAIAVALATVAEAQSWPTRPIRLVLPFPPGAAADAFARPVGPRLAEQLGQPVVIENRAGAGGAIGSDFVAKAAADGYTLLVTFATHYSLPFFQKAVPYDTAKDFTPIIGAASIHTVLAVHPSHPAQTLAEFVDGARKSAAPVQFGVGGTGSGPHLAGELFAQAAGLRMQNVPYRGGGPLLTDLLGGQIGVAFTVFSTAMPHARAGKLRVLAVMSERRLKSAPDLAAVTEAVPGYAMPDIWVGLLGPAGLPRPIVERVHAEVVKALQAPDVRDKLVGAGFDIAGDAPPEVFAREVARSIEIFRRVTAAAGIRPE